MSQTTLSGPYFNSNLFSNHYLDERVYELDGWECDDDAEAALEQIQSLYESEHGLLDTYKEDELLGVWIDEVLSILGFETLL